MPIIEPIIRPPAEADSFLLQVTVGCSANECTFCGAYLRKKFSIKNYSEILKDIERGARRYSHTRRVFLLDGDALVIGNEKLIPLLEAIENHFPKVIRISSYVNGYSITQRTDEELRELYNHKLRLIYMGLESGSQSVLNACRKRATVDEMVEAVRRAAQVGIKSSVMVLLGLGGREHSPRHVRDTISALNRMQPRYLSFLSVMLIPGTPLFGDAHKGHFQELTAQELLDETYAIVKGLELEKTIFRTNHASNYLPLEGRFPQDKERLLEHIRSGIDGDIPLKPEIFRGL